ncbi:hypothetical protein ACHAXR_011966 [Thalassiosira sp. AJA248-18]
MILSIGRSMALMSSLPLLHHGHRRGNGVLLTPVKGGSCVGQHMLLHCHLLRGPGRRFSPWGRTLNSVKMEDDIGDLDEDGYSTTDAKGSGDEDDNDEDEYLGRFISDAFKGEEEGESSSSPPSEDDDDDTSLDETKRMMEQQQEQINLLMKLVQQQQGRQQLPPTSENRIRADATQSSSRQQSQTPMTQQNSINVAPLKAMLFIDGTWLYYSLNSRKSHRDAIIPKFGVGWQNNHKVDWLALPRLICAEIEKQRHSKTSFTGSDRPLEIARVMVFTSAKKDTDPNSIRMRMFREMANANFDVHMMETVGQGEKCVDIQLAVEMLHYATVPNAYDVAILLSGDKDFVPALVRTRQKGKQVCITSMRAGCNRVLYESPHIRDYDVVWLENCLDQLIVPIPAEERSRRDRAGYASAFTMMRVVRDLVETAPDHDWVSSRDIGKYLKTIKIADSNMLEELKQAHGGLRTFLMERACNLFDVKFPEAGAVLSRGKGEFSFWVKVKGDSDETLLSEFKRTQFFTKEEKEFLESYKKEKYIGHDAYEQTTKAANYLDSVDSSVAEDLGEESELDSLDGIVSSPAMDYSQLTVVRLKEICRDKGLPVSGTKSALIDRLEHDRQIEHDIIMKQRREAREASMSKRAASTSRRSPGRPKVTGSATKPSYSVGPGSSSIQMGNIYSSALPQMDASRYRNPRGNSTPGDPAIAAHLEAKIKEYLTASGGSAGSRDIGRYLAANGDSRKGNRSALTELKETFGSLLTFILSREGTFAVLDKEPGYGGDLGLEIKLVKK